MSLHKPSVCVDLDGVISNYTGWKGIDHIGDPNPGAKLFLEELHKFARIILFTTRCKVYPTDKPGPEGLPEPCRDDASALAKRVEDWLIKHDLPFDEVYTGQGKPFAHCYIDNKAVFCDGSNFEDAMGKVRDLCTFSPL